MIRYFAVGVDILLANVEGDAGFGVQRHYQRVPQFTRDVVFVVYNVLQLRIEKNVIQKTNHIQSQMRHDKIAIV